jgi:DNA-binding transcriptional regulator YiaG
MTDRQLIKAAIDSTGLSDRQFALRVVGVNPQTVSNWRRGVRTMEEPTRRLLCLLIRHPALSKELAGDT